MKLSELKVGHKVKGIDTNDRFFTGTVICTHKTHACIKREDGIPGSGCASLWKVSTGYWAETKEDLVRSDGYIGTPLKFNLFLTNKIMLTTSKLIKKLTRKEPEKTFVKAGFMDEDEQITQDGKEALEYILWKANVEELKKLATQVLEDKKDSK